MTLLHLVYIKVLLFGYSRCGVFSSLLFIILAWFYRHFEITMNNSL